VNTHWQSSDTDVLLSVVIPVYNAEPTVQRTVSSLAHISPTNRRHVEVVVVNDGSCDRSIDIARTTAGVLPQFMWRWIDKPNGGVSSARNRGLADACGRWLFFLDADDELVVDLVPLIQAAEGATCLLFCQEFRGPGSRVRRVAPPSLTGSRHLDVFTASCPLQPSGITFKRETIDHLFMERIRYTEDWLFWTLNERIFARTRSISGVKSSIVHIHCTNASANYAGWGIDRAQVAEYMRNHFRGRLTNKQDNNLVLQMAIGRLQQANRIAPAVFLRFPCSAVLYVKLCIYALAALVGFRASYYPTVSASELDTKTGAPGDEAARCETNG
jgi:glycosyltransferase involved in cell wall biosynthesis